MGGGAWWAAVHGVAKSRTRLSDFTFTFHFHALEKEMATHSSVLAWRIPGTGEPGGLPSLGSQSQTRLKQLSSSSSRFKSWDSVSVEGTVAFLNNSKLTSGEGTSWGRAMPPRRTICLRMDLNPLFGGAVWYPGVSFEAGQKWEFN